MAAASRTSTLENLRRRGSAALSSTSELTALQRQLVSTCHVQYLCLYIFACLSASSYIFACLFVCLFDFLLKLMDGYYFLFFYYISFNVSLQINCNI